MSLKPLGEFVYPEDLPLHPEATEGLWWVLHTRPRAEKVLAQRFHLERRGYFLPLRKKELRGGGRIRYSYIPLFANYLFVRGTAEVRRAALETNRVAAVIPVPDQDGLNNALAGIYRSMQAGMMLAVEECYEPGVPVVIDSGALEGTEGKVIQRNGENRFLIELNILGQAVSMPIAGWRILPLRRPALVGAGATEEAQGVLR